MFILYIALVLSTLALVGVAFASYVRVKRHLRASDRKLREVLEQMEHERQPV